MEQNNSNSGDDLPVEIIHHNDDGKISTKENRPKRKTLFRWLGYLLTIQVLLFAGAVAGLYLQPRGLQKFYEMTGLVPGGGTSSPIALPAGIELPEEVIVTLQVTDVLGLARLMPQGDISPVAAPSGAGDARISEILVQVGDRVEKDQIVARLDNLDQLENSILRFEAIVGVREATLAQVRQTILISGDEAKAALAQAEAAAEVASANKLRTEELFERGVSTQAQLDSVLSTNTQAELAVQKAQATLSRFASDDIEAQPDVMVAARNLDAAKADLNSARNDLNRANVRTPISGIVLEVHARLGERPPQNGIMEIGDTSQMMAEVEIHQDRISLIALGQPVEIVSEAIGQTLIGEVERIGLLIGKQDLISGDTAANTDARVIEVLVRLDLASSDVAARYTNLEAVARIDTRAKQ